MSYLLDTNVVSELRLRSPNPKVLTWTRQRPTASLYISVLTLGEIRKGAAQLTDIARRSAIEEWLQADLQSFFGKRILPIDTAIADRWGRLLASAGRTLHSIDSLLAATALQHQLTLVTRNTRDFQLAGLDVINPWQDDEASNEIQEP